MDIKQVCFIALCIVVATVGQCFAQINTGNEIQEACLKTLQENRKERLTGVDSYEAGFCQGFFQATINLSNGLAEPYRFCAPKGVANGQAIRVFLKYLNEHPEVTHNDAGTLAVRAFKAAWPCQ